MSRAGNAARTATGVLGELLITLGVLLLLFVAWQLWWTDVRADMAQGERTDQLQQQWGGFEPDDLPDPAEPVDPGEPPVLPELAAGEAFGIVHVPRFGQGYQPRPVIEGTSQDLLKDGVGHYPGTALPGAVGNVALAGHRVTYGKPFNQVEELVEGDAVVLETEQAWFTYRVTTTKIVNPRDVDVIAPVPGDPTAVPTERMLTLTTCHPMFSARERYIVHAVLETWQPRSAGEPVALTQGAG
ncbi:MAG: class E sortase [Nocardioides sp.]|nr:class E sortase [Nocardioides sp.]